MKKAIREAGGKVPAKRKDKESRSDEKPILVSESGPGDEPFGCKEKLSPIWVYVPEELMDTLKLISIKRHCSLSSLVRGVVEDWISSGSPGLTDKDWKAYREFFKK